MAYSSKTIGISAAVITVTIWTSFIVVARYMALRSLTPIDIVFCRIFGASLVLIPWGFFIVRKQRASGGGLPDWLGISPLSFKITSLIGLFGGVGYSVFAYSGFLFAPAAHASVLLPGTLPLMTALFSVLFLGETINRQRSLGLLLILLGGVLVGGVSIWKGLQNGGNVWMGDVLFLTASTCWATYTVLCRKYALGAVPATVAVICFCAVFFLPSYLALIATGILKSKLLTAPIEEIAFQTVWQGMGSVVISGITFTKMIQFFGPIRSTMITALVPGLSALAAVLFLGEPLSSNLLLGLFLVTFGILVGVRAQSPKVVLS
jgi:drug/metabolite transporter (DMT)-like permease